MRKLALTLLTLGLITVTAAATDFTQIPNRLPQAKVGEWVLMQNVSGDNQGDTVKITVTKVENGAVTVKREHLDADGNVTSVKEHDMNLAKINARVADLQKKAKFIGEETLYIKDQPFETVAVAWDGDENDDKKAGRQFKLWVSPKLPIGGMAKSWSSDSKFPSYEVLDYGF